jgi:hypothetical protein
MNFVIKNYKTLPNFICAEFHLITKIDKILLNFIMAKNSQKYKIILI